VEEEKEKKALQFPPPSKSCRDALRLKTLAKPAKSEAEDEKNGSESKRGAEGWRKEEAAEEGTEDASEAADEGGRFLMLSSTLLRMAEAVDAVAEAAAEEEEEEAMEQGRRSKKR
jgi:hypothetical protein